jgi:citrate lyase subunit beta/citryl-CoA lyase
MPFSCRRACIPAISSPPPRSCALIHPGQVVPCSEIFPPTQEEVEWSRKIIAAFAEPKNQGMGVIVVEGHMMERLHLGMAERTVTIAEQIT